MFFSIMVRKHPLFGQRLQVGCRPTPIVCGHVRVLFPRLPLSNLLISLLRKLPRATRAVPMTREDRQISSFLDTRRSSGMNSRDPTRIQEQEYIFRCYNYESLLVLGLPIIGLISIFSSAPCKPNLTFLSSPPNP